MEKHSENGFAVSDSAAPVSVRAAQYVRMSTEHQKYSTENQADTIARYAAQRGITVVRTYMDEGKSGLSIGGREALKRLIEDVQERRADFDRILVYDVSRWGRFQDADESAYYEFICKEAGISVHYCAEQFENDGSLSATIIKSMKRAMAGEYSRELSAKVFAGQCRLVSLGFRQGGVAGYGLRRQLIDQNRSPKAVLEKGQYKSLQTDRVILVPGPSSEVETVRRIYMMFVYEHRSEREIAAILNNNGTGSAFGSTWTRGAIHQLLINEKYIGNNVYNRVSFKLKKIRVLNAPDMWVRANGAFDAIVSHEIYEAAQRIIEARSKRLSNEEMLECLSKLAKDRGVLSGLIIDEQENMPSSTAYRSRFGSLVRAYQLIGYHTRKDYRYIETNRVLRALHPQILTDTITAIEHIGGAVTQDPSSDLLTINDEFTASLVIARCTRTESGSLRWKVRFDVGLLPDITVVMRMDADNQQTYDYLILPRFGMLSEKLNLAEDNGVLLDAYRCDTLEAFLNLTARTSIRRAA